MTKQQLTLTSLTISMLAGFMRFIQEAHSKTGVAFLDFKLRLHWSAHILPGIISLLVFLPHEHSKSGVDGMLDSSIAALFAFVRAAITFSVPLYSIVFLHELGHVIAGRLNGMRCDKVSILLIGGLAEIRPVRKIKNKYCLFGANAGSEYAHMCTRQGAIKELVVTAAGPMVNVALALPLWLASLMAGSAEISDSWWSIVGCANIWQFMAIVNTAMIVFNLIPAFPMDGGRVLRSVLNICRFKHCISISAERVYDTVCFLSVCLGVFFICVGLGITPLPQYVMLTVIGYLVIIIGLSTRRHAIKSADIFNINFRLLLAKLVYLKGKLGDSEIIDELMDDAAYALRSGLGKDSAYYKYTQNNHKYAAEHNVLSMDSCLSLEEGGKISALNYKLLTYMRCETDEDASEELNQFYKGKTVKEVSDSIVSLAKSLSLV